MITKNIQIPASMLKDVYLLILNLNDNTLDEATLQIKNRIEAEISTKIDAMRKRELYTQSKTAETPQEKENARQAYLDLIALPDKYRYSEEYISEQKNR